jgi:hypothetical protein
MKHILRTGMFENDGFDVEKRKIKRRDQKRGKF